MSERVPHDPFAALIPASAARMPVAWDALRVPGPPAAFALTAYETSAADPMDRFHRRTIQVLDCAGITGSDAGTATGDRLALVDKAIPHALFDLMLSEASPRDKPTPVDVLPITGQLLWRTGLEMVRFVSQPHHQREFALGGGQLHLALNCDPNTTDRESVQAAKQFHLHLLYWTAAELAVLGQPSRLANERSPARRRQCLDPLSFLGARVLHAALSDFEFGILGAELLGWDDAGVFNGNRPLGCVMRLPGWQVLESPAFEDMMRRLHQRLVGTGDQLLDAFTGHGAPPAPWQRYPLQPSAAIEARLVAQGWSRSLREGLLSLAAGLRDLSPAQATRLRRASPVARKHCMTLNLPCYAVNLYAPSPNRADAPLIEANSVYLILQTKLFSGIGGAGLLGLNGIPSVRVVRGQGHFSEAEWRRRAAFQRAFALYNNEALKGVVGGRCSDVRRLLDLEQGWV
ncbi:MAG: hypothetical protein WBM40_00805 [Thiohalocapsa sp.]